jgi:hypothetical protein
MPFDPDEVRREWLACPLHHNSTLRSEHMTKEKTEYRLHIMPPNIRCSVCGGELEPILFGRLGYFFWYHDPKPQTFAHVMNANVGCSKLCLLKRELADFENCLELF